MAGAQTNNLYLQDYPAHAANLAAVSLPWLQSFRQQGLQSFAKQGFPGGREEEWRYTHLAALTKTHFAVSDNQLIDIIWLDNLRLQQAWSVVLLNGRFCAELSRLADLPEGLGIRCMNTALMESPELVERYLGQAVSNDEHSLVAFNSAWFTDGVVIEVAAGLSATQPVQILHVVTAEHALAASRQLFILEADSRVEIVETFAGSQDSYFTAAVNEVFLAENAELGLHKVQTEATQAVHFGGTYVKQTASSRFAHHNFGFGGLLARSDIHSDLQTAAECRLYGLYLGVNRQHIDNHTLIHHLQPQGVSLEFYKGVLDDRARGVFQGRVIVAVDAQHTDSQMNNRNLLLSDSAEIDTKPQLEIYADDVKCSHGVTVGQLEEKSVFYLQSRGLDETSARNILTFAFANEMVDKVENAELKALLFDLLQAHFPAISL